MDWPIETESFEDLTFDYTPEELGIDARSAAKIQEIKRLRPLVPPQPWGIFFVKFEPKRLPVVALRRILSQVVLKKRASANRAERQAWAADDLLFVSNYGEGDDRRITFAHFSQDEAKGDLPTLKVLGWDNLDTPLHLDAIAEKLSTYLTWATDGGDTVAWRTRWNAAFTLRHREVITTSRELSIRLAELARAIRDRIKTALAIETERGPLTRLMKAFQEALVHDLDAEGFADMYAQTIAYGLLSARIANPKANTADHLPAQIPVTNPFLKELMETFLQVGGRRGKAGGLGVDFDELGVSEVVELLDDANMEAVVINFGDLRPEEDPVIHFYELFLKDYDFRKKMQRGVFYTPRPVVSYIVRSVDQLLRTEFGLEDGLAGTTTWGDMAKRHEGLTVPEGTPPDQAFVQILDPACGTGTFLVEVIDTIHRTMKEKWEEEAGGPLLANVEERWNEYVPKHLLPRLHGYELLMAPYAIAHLKIGLKLYETGYRFGSDERARIYLTNSLEPPSDIGQQALEGFLPALAHEAQAVNEIKRNHQFTVVVANPPYANYSANLSPQARSLVDKFRSFGGVAIRERNQLQFERNLQDDFVKFISIAEGEIRRSGVGILGYITNATMLASTSLRGMRERLLSSFTSLFELHLHGGVNEIGQQAAEDENVFEIAQAVSIHAYIRSQRTSPSTVRFAEIWGPRIAKNAYLRLHSARNTEWCPVRPDPENCAFVPQDAADGLLMARVDEVFAKFGAGVKTNRDAIAIALSRAELVDSVRAYSPNLLRQAHPEECIQPILYRPFDERFIFYHEGLIASRSWPTMKHVLAGANIGFVAASTWTAPDRFSVNVSRVMVEMKTGTHDRGTTYFPLYRYDDALGGGAQRGDNLQPEFIEKWTTFTGMRLGFGREADCGPSVNPDDLLRWIYGICHSNGYRSRYRSLLAQGFPIVLFPGSADLLGEVVRLGGELIALHLLEAPKIDHFLTTYSGPQEPEVVRVNWSHETIWLDAGGSRRGQLAAPGTIGFRGVPEAVWNFHMGGYQVCEKWLKDRKGRTLSKHDIAHYQKVIVALNETIRIMKEIDEVIEKHGGWPAAFQTGEQKAAPFTLAPAPVQGHLFDQRPGEAAPFRPRIVEPLPEDRYVTCVPLVPLKAAAGSFGDPQNMGDGDFKWVAVGTKHRLRPGMFVAQVVGRSMEPAIRDGAYCLFAAPVEGTRQGKTVLVQLRDQLDPETGDRYTVKRYESEKTHEGDSWRHEVITLKPVNPAFEPIVLTGDDEGQLQVIAEFLEVLTPPVPASPAARTAEPAPAPREIAHSKPGDSRSAAEKPAAEDDEEDPRERVDAAQLDRDELICRVRQLFGDGSPRDREQAIADLARGLGYEGVGSKVREIVDNSLRTAVRRGVLASDGGGLTLDARRIEDYRRDFLKEQFLASLEGRAWKQRDDAIRDLARWLGFRRTGRVIDQTLRSIINGLIREGRLESDGVLIRKSG